MIPVTMRSLVFCVLACFSATGWAAEPAGLEKQIDALAKKEIEEGRTVGMTVAVAIGDDFRFAKGYGMADLENSVRAAEESVYRIGSITKMFTAAAILVLVEEEKLSLDDAIARFLPDYPAEVAEKVTVRHLLHHTSGIFSFTDLPDHRDGMRRDLKHEDVLARFQDKPLHFEPGERFRYCNSGYYLLGMIVEAASEQKYEEFLRERILDPLELKSVTYDRHLKIIPHRAAGYSMWGEKTVNAPFVSMSQPFSAGALVSNAGDLLTWQSALRNGKLLEPETVELMFTPGKLNDGKPIRYGLGCFVEKFEGKTAIRHGGGIPGFLSELVFFPEEGVAVVVLTNANKSNPRKLINRIAGWVFAKE